MPLEQTRADLKTEFDKAMADESNAIYVFRCATGIGKTRLAINQQESVALAFPTHDLKEEMYAAATIPCEMIPRIPLDAIPPDIAERYDKYCDAGLVRKASHMIRQIADNPYKYNLDKKKATKLVAYFKQLEKCLKTDLAIFTTHQKCVHMNFENKDTYIFDEDPFYAFAKTNSCTTADLRILANTLMTKGNAVDAHKIECIADAMNNYIDIFADTLNIQQFDDSESVVQAIQECAAKKQIKGNVFGLLMNPRPMFYVRPVNNKDPKGDKKISYTTYVPLRDDKKYIILSATAGEFIYRKLYGDRVKFIDFSNVETKGKIHQFSNVGYSRTSMDNNSKRTKLAENFKKELPTITFKTHRDKFTNPVDGIHFGNCEGSNKLEGQDIKIVGTPHLDSTAYRLICKLLDIPASSSDFEFERMKVKHNGYEFNFVTSINPDVRSIQFYCIEKDLIQAVGRARLLNHDCTVYLFSDYPVPNAEQHSTRDLAKVVQLQPNIDKKAA